MAPTIITYWVFSLKSLAIRLIPFIFLLAGAVCAWLVWPRGGALHDDRARLDSRERLQRRSKLLTESARVSAARGRAEAAGLPLTGVMVMAAQAVAAVGVGLVTWRYTGNLFAGAIMGVGGWQIPSLLMELAAAPRRRAYVGQVEGLLVSLSPALHQNTVPLEAVLSRAAQDAPEPLRRDLLRVLAETQYGKPLGVAIKEWAGRRRDNTILPLAAAVDVHDRQGGDLSKALDGIADQIRSRTRIRANHKAESAGERIALLASSIVPTGIYLLFAPQMPTLAAYLHDTRSGAFGVAYLAAVQVGAIMLLRLYVRLPEVFG